MKYSRQSVNCLRSLYLGLVRSMLEYGVIVLYIRLAKDQLRLERDQYIFLSYLYLDYLYWVITILILDVF